MRRRLFLVALFLYCAAAASFTADALTLQVPIGNSATDIPGYLSAVYQWLVRAAVVFAMVAFVVGGIIWTTAGGNKQRVEKAKDIIKNTLIGMSLALGSYALLFVINPALVNWKNIEPGKVSESGLKLEWKKEDETPLTTSCPDACKQEAQTRGSSWTSISGAPENCTPGTETLVNQTVEKCLKKDQLTCKCVLLVQTAGAPNCGTYGCGANYYCNASTNKCEDKKQENADCSTPEECAQGLLCLDSGGTKKCSRSAVATRTGVCCYHATQPSDPSSGSAADIPVALSRGNTTYDDCSRQIPQNPQISVSPWWFCPNLTQAAGCGQPQSLSGAYTGIQCKDNQGRVKTCVATKWNASHLGSLQGKSCTVFQKGSNPRNLP